MSKRCSVCGETNYESATICKNCGSLFKDGAYSPNSSSVRKIEKPESKAISLEKSSKALIAIAISIVVVIAVIAIVCILTLGRGKNNVNNDEIANAPIVSQQEVTDSADQTAIHSANSLGLNGEYNDNSYDSFDCIEKITASERNIEMRIGEIKQISVTIYPENPDNKNLRWLSDNEGIVQIVEETKGLTCKVKAISPGSATITIEGIGADLTTVRETVSITVVDKNKLVTPEQTSDYGDYRVTAKDYLVLRAGPASDYGELSRMKNGDIVRVYAKQSDESGAYWFYVDFKGTKGWALGRFLEEYQVTDNQVTDNND